MVWTPFTCAGHNRSGLRYPSDLKDTEWSLIEPLIPASKPGGRPRSTPMRDVINGTFYLLQSGCLWDFLPRDFPPKSIVHHYFKRFSDDGAWTCIHDELYRATRDLESKEESPSYAIIDSQSVKTGSEAREMVGFEIGRASCRERV